VTTSTNGETTIQYHSIKEEVKTILCLPTTVEEEVTQSREKKIIVVFIVENLGIKQSITHIEL